jgi:protein-S-isoprenylcysteine O-methyltransferase Ste14
MHPSWKSILIGGSIAGLGALIRIWAAGYIDKGKALATAGPYSLTRNPLYLGSLIMAFGVLIAGQMYWFLLPFAVLFLLLYLPVMKREEQNLSQEYGEEFFAYVKRVPRFLPRFRSVQNRTSSFRWERVKHNREHWHVLVLILSMILLVLKSILWP